MTAVARLGSLSSPSRFEAAQLSAAAGGRASMVAVIPRFQSTRVP
jgi:hypothetical protein